MKTKLRPPKARRVCLMEGTTSTFLPGEVARAGDIPGVFVLPILAALWIGSKAGSTSGKLETISYRAVINAVYLCVIYMIEIFVFYIISGSTHTGALSAVSLIAFIEYVVAMPVIVCLIVSPLFAMVSSARRDGNEAGTIQ